MAKRRTKHHTQLEQLRDTELGERITARDLEAEAGIGRSAANTARQALVQAHVDGIDPKRAEKQRAEAEAQAEDLVIRVEAATLRVKRAEAERNQYEASHAEHLIAELEPEAEAATKRLDQAARELVAADAAWHAVEGKIGTLLAAMPNASSRTDGSGEHRLTEVVRQARRAIASGEVGSPMPTWQGVKAQEEQQRAVRLLREGDAA